MHPLLVLLAFSLAAMITYVLVLGLLTALSIPRDGAEAELRDGPRTDPASGRAARGEHARS